MPREEDILAAVSAYIGDEVLEGEDLGLDASTPLLELGVLNSMEIVRLVGFLRSQYDLAVDNSEIMAENFSDIASITQMVSRLMDGWAPED